MSPDGWAACLSDQCCTATRPHSKSCNWTRKLPEAPQNKSLETSRRTADKMTINWGQPSEAPTTSFRANRNRHQHHRRSQENRPDLLGALGKTFQDFCRTTKVNGPYYLQKEVTKGWARAIWTVIPIVLFATGLVLVSSLWSRYMSSPTRMTIGKPLSITDVPFPAVTICHTQSVISYKAEEFVERM